MVVRLRLVSVEASYKSWLEFKGRMAAGLMYEEH